MPHHCINGLFLDYHTTQNISDSNIELIKSCLKYSENSEVHVAESKRTKEVSFKPTRERDNALMTHTPYIATILDKFARNLLSVR